MVSHFGSFFIVFRDCISEGEMSIEISVGVRVSGGLCAGG